jgi:hypothetical protein
MGAVYVGVHEELGIERAVKILTGKFTPARIGRFFRETQNLARIRHPNVIAIHDVGQTPEGGLYYAMEKVEGLTLDEVRGARLELDRALELMIAVCEGVAALHELEIVHRDLKPNNILVRADGSPVVLDLGLAFALDSDSRLTKTGVMLGTPLYMSPEQACGKRPELTADVFSLGLIALELTSGLFLTELDQIPAIIPPPLPSAVDPTLSPALDAVVGKALAPVATERYASAGEFGQALRRVRANPGSSRRQQRLAWAGVALGLLVAGGAVAHALAAAPDREPTSVPSPDAQERPSPLAPAALARAREELKVLRGIPQPRKRHAAAQEWLARFPAHPEQRSAVEVRDEAQRHFPLEVLWQRSRSMLRPYVKWQGEYALVAWSDTVRRWRMGSTRELVTDSPTRGQPFACSLSSDGRLLYQGTSEGEVIPLTWSGEAVPRITSPPLVPLGKPQVSAVACSADGRWLAVARDGWIQVLELPGRRPALRARIGNWARALVFSPHEPLLAVLAAQEGHSGRTLDRRKVVAVWNLETEERVFEHAVMSRPNAAVFLPDSRILIGTNGGRIALHRLGKGNTMERQLTHSDSSDATTPHTRAHSSRVRTLALGPTGRLLLSATDQDDPQGGGELAVWDLPTGRRVHYVLEREGFRGVALSPDGRRMIVSRPNRVELWVGPVTN